MLALVLTIVAKAALYAGALSAAGSGLAAATLRRSVPPRLWSNSLLVVLAASLSSLGILFVRLGGFADAATLGAVLETPVGICLICQGLAAIMGLAFVRLQVARYFVLPALLCGFAFAGHAAGKTDWAGPIAGLHAALAAWWIGALWLLHGQRNTPDFDNVVRAFGRQALLGVGGLVVAGIVLVIALLGLDSDFGSAYVGWLLIKLAIVAAVLGLAAINRLVLTPSLDSRPGARQALAATIRIELGLILTILTVTAAMTTLSSPMRPQPVTTPPSVPVTAGTLTIRDYVLRASLGNVPASALYLTVDNAGQSDDRLLAASVIAPGV